MKRQAEGVNFSEVEHPETNGSKRIKLLNNEENEVNVQADGGEETIMNNSTVESKNNHKEIPPSISKNSSPYEHLDVVTETDNNINNLPQSTNENGNFNHVENNHNGSSNESVVKASTSNSEVTSEVHYSNSHENSVVHTEDQNEKEDACPVLNHFDHDIHNSESTDSFQSESFEADSCTQESGSEMSQKDASNHQEQKDDEKKESPVETVVEKSIDVENLSLSHLKITELEGHTDVVFSVAADEDYILSASADTTVKVWSIEHKSTISTFSGHSDSVTSLVLLNPNQSKILKKKVGLAKVSRLAITGSLDCHIKLWSVLEGKELASAYTYNGITCLSYLESECLVVIGTEGGKIELWDLSSLEVKRSERAHEDAITDIKIKDNFIYSVSVDGTVKVWTYEDDDIYPLYTRKRKEISSDKTGYKPAQWKTVAVSGNRLYLGDSTSNVKVLDWKAGHLRLFRNQTETQAICECIAIENDMLFSACYDLSSDTGAINVWKFPEMSYVCTLNNGPGCIKSLAVMQKDNRLQVVCGGYKLYIWEFDFSKPPGSETESNVCELETLGLEIDEKPVEINQNKTSALVPDENASNNRWCSVM